MRGVADATENTPEQLWRQVQYAQLGTLGIALQFNSIVHGLVLVTKQFIIQSA